MKRRLPRGRCVASFEWRHDAMVLTLSLAHPTPHQVERFQKARIQIGAAHSRSVVFVCYSVDRLADGQAPYNVHALPMEEWPNEKLYAPKKHMQLTLKLRNATDGSTCAERVVVLSFRVSHALIQELVYQAERPIPMERYEQDLAEALASIKTPALHACAMMDPAGPPKDPSLASLKKPAPPKREEAALNKLYNTSIDVQHFRDAVNAIDELVLIREDLEILRAKLLALDGIESPAGEGDDRYVFDLAEELSLTLSESLETLGKTESILDKITLLDPRNQEVEDLK